MSRAPQGFGDSRLGESVLAVWQAVTDSIPVPRTSFDRTSMAVFDPVVRAHARYVPNEIGRRNMRRLFQSKECTTDTPLCESQTNRNQTPVRLDASY